MYAAKNRKKRIFSHKKLPKATLICWGERGGSLLLSHICHKPPSTSVLILVDAQTLYVLSLLFSLADRWRGRDCWHWERRGGERGARSSSLQRPLFSRANKGDGKATYVSMSDGWSVQRVSYIASFPYFIEVEESTFFPSGYSFKKIILGNKKTLYSRSKNALKLFWVNCKTQNLFCFHKSYCNMVLHKLNFFKTDAFHRAAFVFCGRWREALN